MVSHIQLFISLRTSYPVYSQRLCPGNSLRHNCLPWAEISTDAGHDTSFSINPVDVAAVCMEIYWCCWWDLGDGSQCWGVVSTECEAVYWGCLLTGNKLQTWSFLHSKNQFVCLFVCDPRLWVVKPFRLLMLISRCFSVVWGKEAISFEVCTVQ